jgi:transposase
MLFVGDDWAKDHHDVVLVDEKGKRLAYRRFPEGMAGVSGLHGLIAAHLPMEWVDLPPGEAASRVKIGIERDHGVWVQALVAAGYEVFAINPFSVANYRSRRSTSGAKSDAADALLLAVSRTRIGRITARWPQTPTEPSRSSSRRAPTRR